MLKYMMPQSYNCFIVLQNQPYFMSRNYVVQRIVGKRQTDGKIEYQVKWKDFPKEQNTWEPLKHLKNVQKQIQEFEQRNSQRLQQKGFDGNAKKKPTPAKVNSRSPRLSSQRSNTSPKVGARRVSRSSSKKQTQSKTKTKSPVIKKPKIEERKTRKRISLQVEEDDEDEQRVKKPALRQKKAKLRQQAQIKIEDQIEGNLKNLDKIADQISQIAKRKWEECKVVSHKNNDSDGIVYVVQSRDGKIYDCSKEELIKNNPCALVDYLELPFKDEQKIPPEILNLMVEKIANL